MREYAVVIRESYLCEGKTRQAMYVWRNIRRLHETIFAVETQ